MYIKADYKDQYFDYLRSFEYPANTVRILRSDIKSLFIWLDTLNFKLSIEKVRHEYRKHLVANKTPVNTQNRKLSSVSKFLGWVNEHYPTTPLHTNSMTILEPLKSPKENDSSGKSSLFSYATRLSVLIGGVVITLISLFFVSSILLSSKSALKSDKKPTNSQYYISFLLSLKSLNRPLQEDKDSLEFKFYRQSDQNTSIGYTSCPFVNRMMLEGSSRLRVNFDTQCGQLPYEVYDAIARSEAIFVDIYLNGLKINTSKVVIPNPVTDKAELTHQEEMSDALLNASNVSSSLPNSSKHGQVLGSGIATSPAVLQESIPFSIFKDVPLLDDGDIVSIYNGEVTRALLSTDILGIVSGNTIITKGIAYIHVINSSDTPILVGDLISTSTTPGFGKKATNTYDSIVGIALEPLTPGKSFLKVSLVAH